MKKSIYEGILYLEYWKEVWICLFWYLWSFNFVNFILVWIELILINNIYLIINSIKISFNVLENLK